MSEDLEKRLTMLEKKVEELEKYMHPEITYLTPIPNWPSGQLIHGCLRDYVISFNKPQE